VKAALRDCGSPCNREKLLRVLNSLNVQTAGVYPDPVVWTKDDHRRPASFTAYVWDTKSQSVRRVTEWSRVMPSEFANVKVVD
jgi:hypothetical protein